MTSDIPEDVMSDLTNFRRSIDNLDAALIYIMSERFRITRSVGKLKAEHNLPASDPDREAELIARLRQLAIESDLDPDFTESFLNFVIREVVRQHEQARG